MPTTVWKLKTEGTAATAGRQQQKRHQKLWKSQEQKGCKQQQAPATAWVLKTVGRPASGRKPSTEGRPKIVDTPATEGQDNSNSWNASKNAKIQQRRQPGQGDKSNSSDSTDWRTSKTAGSTAAEMSLPTINCCSSFHCDCKKICALEHLLNRLTGF